MSKLDEWQVQLTEIVTQLGETRQMYLQALNALEASKAGQALNVSGVGLALHIGNMQVPIAMPADPMALQAHLSEAVNFLANESIRLWGEAHGITTNCMAHCNQALETARQQMNEQEQPPQYGTPPLPPQPRQQPPVAGQQPPPQSSQQQFRTTPLT